MHIDIAWTKITRTVAAAAADVAVDIAHQSVSVCVRATELVSSRRLLYRPWSIACV